jgi:hypothetical protein
MVYQIISRRNSGLSGIFIRIPTGPGPTSYKMDHGIDPGTRLAVAWLESAKLGERSCLNRVRVGAAARNAGMRRAILSTQRSERRFCADSALLLHTTIR